MGNGDVDESLAEALLETERERDDLAKQLAALRSERPACVHPRIHCVFRGSRTWCDRCGALAVSETDPLEWELPRMTRRTGDTTRAKVLRPYEDRTRAPSRMHTMSSGWAHMCIMDETRSVKEAVAAAWDFVDDKRAEGAAAERERIADLFDAKCDAMMKARARSDYLFTANESRVIRATVRTLRGGARWLRDGGKKPTSAADRKTTP